MDSTVAQLILNDRKIAYALTDRNLIVVEISGAVNILRHNGGAMLGRPLVDLVPELIGSEAALAQLLDGELPRLQLAWVNRENSEGQTSYLTMVDLPYRDRSGRIVGLIHLVEDVTEMGRLEQSLTQQRNELRFLRDELKRQNTQLSVANAELQRLDELKSTFVSIAAHELRTPLASICGYLEMLLDGDAGSLTERQAEYLHIIQGSADRLLAITSELLDLTRIEAGRVELALRPTDLVALVEDVASEQAPQLEAKAQRLTLRAAHDLPLALCDPMRTAQIVGNLLSNASKYTPVGGQIMLTLASAADPGFLQISISDTGVGIPPADRPHLFDKFFRASNAVETGASGIGLGLHIARALVELHGGRIWLAEHSDVGATFHFTLPRAAAD